VDAHGLDGDGLDFHAGGVRYRQAVFGEALEVEGDALARELFDFGASCAVTAKPGRAGT
jgi:hypothetical protein